MSAHNNSTNYDASCHGTSSEDAAVMMSIRMMSIRIYFGATLAFVVIGLVGNALSMLVFSSREMQAVSSNVYLLTLATVYHPRRTCLSIPSTFTCIASQVYLGRLWAPVCPSCQRRRLQVSTPVYRCRPVPHHQPSRVSIC